MSRPVTAINSAAEALLNDKTLTKERLLEVLTKVYKNGYDNGFRRKLKPGSSRLEIDLRHPTEEEKITHPRAS